MNVKNESSYISENSNGTSLINLANKGPSDLGMILMVNREG